jgi:hypothetical protein
MGQKSGAVTTEMGRSEADAAEKYRTATSLPSTPQKCALRLDISQPPKLEKFENMLGEDGAPAGRERLTSG